MIEIELLTVSDDMTTGTPVLVLREREGSRALAISIGSREAESIGWALENIEFPRPMTHDLLRIVVEDLDATVDRVCITDVEGGTYRADLVLRRGTDEVHISARPSDAVALALRTGSPLFADDELLDLAGVELSEDVDDEVDEGEMVEQFREFLEAVQPEDFAP